MTINKPRQLATACIAMIFTSVTFALNNQSASGVPVIIIEDVQAKELMKKVIDRYEGTGRLNTMSLVTCSYEIKKGKGPKCTSQPRKKSLYSVTKKYGATLEDVRSLTMIKEPVAENGIGILQYDYDEAGKDTDQWLYLPEIGQVKRVASSDDAPKKGSLFGSEFSMEDIEQPKVEDYRYRIVGEDIFSRRKVTLIEQIPVAERARKTNYSKRIQWVDAERLLVLKTENFDWSGELHKTSYIAKVKKINEIWTAIKYVMNNVQSKRISVMNFNDVKYNHDVGDDMFAQRVLIDPIFRQMKLSSLNFF